MKTKKIIAVILAAVMTCCVFTACSKEEPTAGTTTEPTTALKAANTTEPTTEAAKDTSFELTDANSNVFKAFPVYNVDGTTIIAGYIFSAKDKDGKELDQKACPYIKQVIAVDVDDKGNKKIKYTEDKKIITLAALADDKGNIIAIQDALDLDKDKDTKEYFKATTTVNGENDITIKLDKDTNGKLINVTVKTEQRDGKKVTTVIDKDGNKQNATQSTNSTNINQLGKDKDKNKKPADDNTKKDTPNNAGDNNNNNNDDEISKLPENSIVLKKNGKGITNAAGVTFSEANHQGVCKITADGKTKYTITSDVAEWHGQILIELPNTAEAEVRFENVNISSSTANVIKILDKNVSEERTFFEEETTSGTPSDNVLSETMKVIAKQESAPDVDLVFPTGTTSSFETNANSYSGVIYNESKLTIKGNGKVNIKASKNKNNAICTTKSITFKNVTANLETEAASASSSMSSSRGIFSYSKVTVESGKVKIRSNGDCIRCDDLYVNGGELDMMSGACDGVDADDRIIITDGKVTSIALQKSSFKVRRLNNQNDYNELLNPNDPSNTIKAEDCVTKENHVFKIDGGTVWGEGKNCTKTQFLSSKHKNNLSQQVSLLIRSSKSESSEQTRKYIQFNISGSGVNVTSHNKCGKFFYSSPQLSTDGVYTISSPQGVAPKEISQDEDRFIGTSGTCKIVSA